MFTPYNLYAVVSFSGALPIGRNANEHNDLKDAHLPLENLNLDVSRVRIDTCTEFVYSTLSSDFGYKQLEYDSMVSASLFTFIPKYKLNSVS